MEHSAVVFTLKWYKYHESGRSPARCPCYRRARRHKVFHPRGCICRRPPIRYGRVHSRTLQPAGSAFQPSQQLAPRSGIEFALRRTARFTRDSDEMGALHIYPRGNPLLPDCAQYLPQLGGKCSIRDNLHAHSQSNLRRLRLQPLDHDSRMKRTCKRYGADGRWTETAPT